MTAFNKKKEKALAHLDMEARETALKQFGIEDRFEFADHTKIYNAEHGRFHSAPIEMVSVPTGYITPPSSYYHPSDSSYSPPSPTPEMLAWRLRAEERARAEDMRRAEQHFQRVHADELAQAGRENNGLRFMYQKLEGERTETGEARERGQRQGWPEAHARRPFSCMWQRNEGEREMRVTREMRERAMRER